ncbi:hypothetical protein FHX74_003435 [Friedmanniella endophytica]|uniref:Uncharacterized protein n=1 Tax=Microlunatus kandeliicorticis TaxID=1759536 RepID=A0A7W3P798_9ACTN|nr:hypothetical protein [Microlunatus kandeliicorticis]MBA8795794.1 hypothetical protein [Microlunatus kandeliicorticis]
MRVRSRVVRAVAVLGALVVAGGAAVLLVGGRHQAAAWAAWEQARRTYPPIDTADVERAYRVWLTLEAAGLVVLAAGLYLLLVGLVLACGRRLGQRRTADPAPADGAIPSGTRSIATR